MARVKIEDILYHLDHDLKKALEATIKEHYPGVNVDRNRVYKTFMKQAYRKCSTWEQVPDSCVEAD